MKKETLESIFEKAEAYQIALSEARERISEYRILWNSTTKDTILRTFDFIKISFPNLAWDIQKIEVMENMDLVNLGFKSESSGIVGQIRGIFKFFAKESGRLNYAQVYNGEVYVSVSYPFVEEHVERQPNKFIGKYTPNEIDTDLVLWHIDTFLTEMMEWETGTRKIIGFLNS